MVHDEVHTVRENQGQQLGFLCKIEADTAECCQWFWFLEGVHMLTVSFLSTKYDISV